MTADAAHRLHIEPAGWTLVVPPGRTLLQAVLAAGGVMPSSCRNGTCRACRCRLRAGEVGYLVEWPGLLPEEKSEGWILPCVAVARSDLLIEAAVEPPAR